MREAITLKGRGVMIIRDRFGKIVEREEFENKVVYAGLGAIVDALVAAAYINTWHYVGFGTDGTTTSDDATALTAEIAGGSYARLDATQAEGDNAREYRLSGTWTNNSGSTQVVAEVGIFTAATAGTMLARSCTADDGWTAKSIDNGGTLEIAQWDIQLADA